MAGALSASPDPDPDGAQDMVRLWRAAMAILWPAVILDVEVTLLAVYGFQMSSPPSALGWGLYGA